MDLIISLRKYKEIYKVVFAFSVMFLFLLFLINPLFSLFGGSLNLSYNILSQSISNIILTIISVLVVLFIYSLLQTIIIYKIGKDYSFSDYIKLSDIKHYFYRVVKFNWMIFFLFYGISVFLYNIHILNNLIIDLIFLFITIVVWFVPQIIIMEGEKIGKSILISIIYFKKNWFYIITLFAVAIILFLITNVLDMIFPSIYGYVISSLFLILFTLPFIEILKSEVYLNKYKLLKPKK